MIINNEDLLIPGRPEISSIVDLPLKSQYRVLHWYGLADGTNLTQGFQINDLVNRYVVLKSFKITAYGVGVFVDFYVNDGVVSNVETIPALTRINRLFDSYEQSAAISMVINGSPLGMFNSIAPLVQFPLDMDLDNIFYLFKAKVQTWEIQVNASVVDDIENNTRVDPNIKVVCECYIV